MLQLQRQAGNQAVQQLLRARGIQAGDVYQRKADRAAYSVLSQPRQTPLISHAAASLPVQRKCAACEEGEAPLQVQTRLDIGAVDDPLEHEADAVADQLMRIPNLSATPVSHGLQRKCDCGGVCSQCQEEQLGQGQRPLQMKSGGAGAQVGMPAPPTVHEVLRSPSQPLDPATRSFMEPHFRRDFSSVRVHADAPAAESAGAIHALAYTVGNHIVFDRGQYSPHSDTGRRLLAHELTHVVQQGGSAPTSSAANKHVVPAGEHQVSRLHSSAGTLVQRRPSSTSDGLYLVDFPDWIFLDQHAKPKSWQWPSGSDRRDDKFLDVPIPELGGSVEIRGAVSASSVFRRDLTGKLSNIQVGLEPIEYLALGEGGVPAISHFSGTADLSIDAAVSMDLIGEGEIRMAATAVGLDLASLGAFVRLTANGIALLKYGGATELHYQDGHLKFEFSQTQKQAELGLKFSLIAGIVASLVGGLFSWTKTWTLAEAEIKKTIWAVEAPVRVQYDNQPNVDTPLTDKLESALKLITRVFEAAHSIDLFLRDPQRALPGGPGGPPSAPPGGGGLGPGSGGGTGSTSGPCGGNRTPAAHWEDFHHYSRHRLSGPMRKGQDWTDYFTNSQAEARAATGVPDSLCYRATLRERDASPYLPSGTWHDRRFDSIVFGQYVGARHFTAIADVPENKYSVDVLDAQR